MKLLVERITLASGWRSDWRGRQGRERPVRKPELMVNLSRVVMQVDVKSSAELLRCRRTRLKQQAKNESQVFNYLRQWYKQEGKTGRSIDSPWAITPIEWRTGHRSGHGGHLTVEGASNKRLRQFMHPRWGEARSGNVVGTDSVGKSVLKFSPHLHP